MPQPAIQPKKDRRFERNMQNIDNIIDDLSSSIYGGEMKDEVSSLQDRFNDIMKTEIQSIVGSDRGDTTSFINKLYQKDSKNSTLSDRINREFSELGIEGANNNVNALINDVYKNRILKQADIHEVASQLIELKEAVGTMRDAIFSPDLNTGRINREIGYGNASLQDNGEYYTTTIENMEEKLDIHKKIKDYIGYNVLEQGEYYAYTIPYSEIFNNFMKVKDQYRSTQMYAMTESAEEIRKQYRFSGQSDSKVFIESCYENYISQSKKKIDAATANGIKSDIAKIVDRVSVVTDPIPIPIIEEGIGSLEKFRETYVNESGDMFCEKPKELDSKNRSFENFMKQRASEGTYLDEKKPKRKAQKIEDMKDCYIKMLSGRELIPIGIMKETIGYLYIKSDDEYSLDGSVSSQLSYLKFNEGQREHSIVDDIATRIIDQLDNDFVKNNPKFRKIIVEAINYFDLNERRVCFQFIPKEYIFPFKINVDEDGYGQSMLEDSLFYAKLYLMLLLFKIMCIVIHSEDQKVNYVQQSGIDVNMANNVQDIIRDRQSRKINILDLFNYTSLMNKIGTGSEIYIPTGRNNNRPMETEILSGQQIQLNTELMELLRNSYILGTGVPAAIMNYLNEADFAKSIETANTKFNGRVVSYQLDLNPGLTEWYRALLRWTTDIEETVINEITISLPRPKTSENNITQELIGNFTSACEFYVKMYYGENIPQEKEAEVVGFQRALAKIFLPMIDFNKIDEIYEMNAKEAVGKRLSAQVTSNDNLEEELKNF